jgi:hypothetical protein
MEREVGHVTEKVLEEPKQYFWLRSGPGLRSLRELANKLPAMPADEFAYHAGPPRHDFAAWTEGVFGEKELAERLRKCRTKEEFQTVLYNHLVRHELHKRKEERAQRHEAQKAEHHVPASHEVPKAEHHAHSPEPRTPNPEPSAPPSDASLASDPATFSAYHAAESKRNDALADRFDAVARRFAEAKVPLTPENVTKRIEAITSRYKELRTRVADARKQGKDPLIADLTLRPVPAKLEYARVSEDERDFQQIETILREAEFELQEELELQSVDAKRDVEQLAGRAPDRGGR